MTATITQITNTLWENNTTRLEYRGNKMWSVYIESDNSFIHDAIVDGGANTRKGAVKALESYEWM